MSKSVLISLIDSGFDIKNKRLSLQLSQEQVAKYCGVSLQAYQRWERGITKYLRQENYEKLKEIFGIKYEKCEEQ